MTDKQSADENGENADSAKKARLGRKRIIVSTAVAVIVAVVGIGYGVSKVVGGTAGDSPPNGKSEDSSGLEHCDAPTEDTGISEPEKQPVNGGVEAAESGVNLAVGNTIADVMGGVLVKNTSNLVARQVTVKTSLMRDGGAVVRDGDGEPVVRESAVRYIMPGGSFGTGLFARAQKTNIGDAPKLKTEFSVEEWWQPNNDVRDFATLTATVDSEQDNIEDHFNVAVDSQFCEEVGAARASMIFRNPAGNIIYGVDGITPQRDTGGLSAPPVEKYQPGANKHLEFGNYLVPNAQAPPGLGFETKPDWDQTEIFPYVHPDKKK